MKKIAVIDTETNYSNELISIGVVIADAASFKTVEEHYAIVTPAYRKNSMFAHVLRYPGINIDAMDDRRSVMEGVKQLLLSHGVGDLYAYNAGFDSGLLHELSDFVWFDIMKVAAYKQYNPFLPADAEICSTGRLKRDYGVQAMYRLLSGDFSYCEVHNALADARDELRLMEMLGRAIAEYDVAILSKK